MSIAFGPKLGLLYNANINEAYYDQFRPFLQAIDQLIMGSVINSTTVVPPVSPSAGNAYLISSTPSGAWASFPVNSIAVWDTQVTLSGTNTLNPSWVNYVPNAGWTIWNVATSALLVYNGSAWTTVGNGANFPTNTNITSMTGIPNTTISTAGYLYSDGTLADTTNITPGGWAWGNTAGNFDASTGGVFVGNQAWSGLGYTGIGVAVQNTSGVGTIIGAGTIGTGSINTGSIAVTTLTTAGGTLRVGTGTVGTPGIIQSFSTGQALSIGPLGAVFASQTALTFFSGTSAPTSGVGLIGFSSNYATQTTVGAAGTASVIPGAPKKWIQITDTDGAIVVFPVWAYV